MWLWEIGICFTDHSAFSLCLSLPVPCPLSSWLRCYLFLQFSLSYYEIFSLISTLPLHLHTNACITPWTYVSSQLCLFHATSASPCIYNYSQKSAPFFSPSSHCYNAARKQPKSVVKIVGPRVRLPASELWLYLQGCIAEQMVYVFKKATFTHWWNTHFKLTGINDMITTNWMGLHQHTKMSINIG